MNHLRRCILLIGLLLVFVTSSVILADNRINPPPYHFGGDALYCTQGEGCWLLNAEGQYLTTWAESDIAAALEAADATGQNTLVGEGPGTYGTAALWAVLADDGDDRQLCLFAYDEWGKQNHVCFVVTVAGVYIPVGMTLAMLTETSEEPLDACAAFSVGMTVELNSDPTYFGVITFIDPVLQELSFWYVDTISYPVWASCSDVHEIIT